MIRKFTLFILFALIATVGKSQCKVTVNPPMQMVCLGNPTALNTQIFGTTGAVTYQWFEGANSLPYTTPDISFVPTASSKYYVIITDQSGCTSIDSSDVMVDNLISGITASQNTICTSDTVTLTEINQIPGLAFIWSSTGSGDILTSPTLPTIDVLPIQTTTYTVTVNDNNGCSATSNITITLGGTPPVVDAGQDLTVCSGDTVTLGGNPTASGNGPFTYQWKNIQNGNTFSGANPKRIVNGNKEFEVLVSDASGCSASDTIKIDIFNPITKSVTSSSVCGTSTGFMKVNVTSGTVPYSYSFSPSPAPVGFQLGDSIGNLTPKTYYVIIKDGNGCTYKDSATIKSGDISTSTSSTNVSCFGYSNGTATVTATGGLTGLPFLYQWSNGKTTASINNLTAGKYFVSVIQTNGCLTIDSVIISQPAGMVLSPTITDASCSLGNKGSISINVSNSTGPYSYNWNITPNPGTSSISNLNAGTYKLTVTDSLGCNRIGSFTIVDTSAVKSNFNFIYATCGNSDGAITVNSTVGFGSLTYKWSANAGGSTSTTVSNLSKGLYKVTVTSTNGCVGVDSMYLYQLGTFNLQMFSSDATCSYNNDGSVSAFPTGGTGFTYKWSTGSTNDYIDSIPAGVYKVTVSDNNGCVKIDSVHIGPTKISTSFSTTNPTCRNADGSITVAATGGTGSLNYLWSTSATTNSINNLLPGSFTVTVSDSLGCIKVDTATLTPVGRISLTFTTTASSVNGDGTATTNPSGGSLPYTYLWDASTGGQTAQTAVNLFASAYKVTVTDNIGCTESGKVVVPAVPPVSLSLGSTNISCFGVHDGTITTTVSGGIGAPYTFSWKGPSNYNSTSANPSNLAAGTYNVTVTDAKNNTDIGSVVLTQPAQIFPNIVITNATCADSLGKACSNQTGNNWAYSWSTGDTTSCIDKVNGTYTVIITNQTTGCSINTSAVIGFTTSAPIAKISAGGPTTFCDGDSVQISNQSGIYTYQWYKDNVLIPGATSQSIQAKLQGSYTVAVNNGCSTAVSAPVTVSVTPIEDATFSYPGTYFCKFGSNPTPTKANFGTFSSDAGLVFVSTQNGKIDLASSTLGRHIITFTTLGTCPGTKKDTIYINGLPDARFSYGGQACQNTGNINAVLLSGATPGSFSATPSGITFADTLGTINSGATSPGTYFVTNNVFLIGCGSAVYTDTISVLPQPAAPSVTSNYSYCQNATATCLLTGNNLKWYTVPNGGTPDTASCYMPSTIYPGVSDYYVSQTINGCESPRSVINVNVHASPVPPAVVSPLNYCQNETAAPVIATGTNLKYYYHITDTGIVTPIIPSTIDTGIAFYYATQEDGFGCRSSHSPIMVHVHPIPPAPAQISVLKVCLNSIPDTLLASGQNLKWYSQSNGTGLLAGNLTVATSSPIDTMFYVTQTVNNCVSPLGTIERIVIPKTIVQVTTNDVTCYGNMDGQIYAQPAGLAPFSYNWSNSQTTANISGLGAGYYSITVLDSIQCSVVVDSIKINEPTLLIIGRDSSVKNICKDDATGKLYIYPSGGTPVYSCSWTNSMSGDSIWALPSGSYGVTVTDANGCTATGNYNVLALDTVKVQTSFTNIGCWYDSTGTASVIPYKGFPPYSYTWSTGESTSQIEGLKASVQYSVTTTDSKGCTETSLFTLSTLQTAPIQVETGAIPAHSGVAEGAAWIKRENADTLAYTIRWLTQQGETTNYINHKLPGKYGVNITDTIWHCTKSLTVEIPVNTAILNFAGKQSLIQIYPNPSNGLLNLKFDNLNAVGGKIKLFDLDGQKVFETNIQNTEMNFTLPEIPAGIYSIEVNFNKETFRDKIVIQK